MSHRERTTDHCRTRLVDGLFRFAFLFSLLPALCLAQRPEAVTNQSVLDELKSIRATLERMEKAQKALLALTRIQMDAGQMTALEERRLRLSSQERDLNRRIAAASRQEAPAAMAIVAQSDGTAPDPVVSTEASLARAHVEQASRELKEVASARQTVEQEIAKLKARIAAMESYFEEAMR